MNREKDSHKGENGKVGVIGGSVDFSGAPALSAQAALRTGSDLVKVLTSNSVRDVVRGYSENLIVEGYDSKYFGEESLQRAEKLEAWADCLVVGPGISRATQNILREFLENSETPLVVDAEAIQTAVMSEVSNAVFTPHQGEAKIIKKEYESIQEFVEVKDDLVVLVKGSKDFVYSESGLEKISAGHPGMTVGGTGDILTGILAAFLSRGISKKEAAIKAVEINGKSGEKAGEKYGNGLVATDMLEEIPRFI